MAIQFQNESDEDAYREWVSAHPNGYCIELRRNGLAPLVHRVGCCCLGIEEIYAVPFPLHCFSDGEDVKAWFYEFDDNDLSSDYVFSLEECEVCDPQFPLTNF